MAITLAAKPCASISPRISVAAPTRLASVAYGGLPMLPIILLCVLVVPLVGQRALATCAHDPLAGLTSVRPLSLLLPELPSRKGLLAFLASVCVFGLGPEVTAFCGRSSFPAFFALHILTMVEIIVSVSCVEMLLR